ncbi:MAG: hypothetical protein WCG27_09405, partial [Pseudomonadota bacterium]
RTFYSEIEDLSYQTLLNEEQVNRFVSTHLSNASLRPYRQELETVLKSPLGSHAPFFLELYKMRGNLEEQTKLFDSYPQKTLLGSPKSTFLSYEILIKKALYKDIIVQAVSVRRQDINRNLLKFCDLDVDNIKEMKLMVADTAKLQSDLNKMAGLPATPPQVLALLSKWAAEDWRDLKWGIASAVLLIGGTLLVASCAAVTGGLCAAVGVPALTGAIAAYSATAGGVGIMIWLQSKEYDRKLDADMDFADAKEMHELGYTTLEGAEEVSRTWTWAVVNAALFAIPFAGTITRGGKMGIRATVAGIEALGKDPLAVREAMRSALTQLDIQYAQYILGMKSMMSPGNAAVQQVQRMKMKQLLKDLTQGKITKDVFKREVGLLWEAFKTTKVGFELLGPVALKSTLPEINLGTAQVVSRYFGGNALKFKEIFAQYTKGRLKWALGVHKMLLKFKKVPLVNLVANGLDEARYAHFVKNLRLIRQTERAIARAIEKGDPLENILLENMSTLQRIFVDMPTPVKEWPYLFILQGGGHIGGLLNGARVPGLYKLADTAMLRRFFNASARLTEEAFRVQAAITLNLGANVAHEYTSTTVKAFQESVEVAIQGAEDQTKAQMSQQYEQWQVEVSNKVTGFIMQQSKGGARNFKIKGIGEDVVYDLTSATEIRRILFNPGEKLTDELLSRLLWNNMSDEVHKHIFELRALSDLNHEALQQLSYYQNDTQFGIFWNALRMRVLKNRSMSVDSNN